MICPDSPSAGRALPGCRLALDAAGKMAAKGVCVRIPKLLMPPVFFAALLLPAAPALAYDWTVNAHVTLVEGSDLPASLPFTIDMPAGSCAPGTFLTWTIRGSDAATRNINVQAVYAMLMTALKTGSTVRITGSNSGCAAAFIYLL